MVNDCDDTCHDNSSMVSLGRTLERARIVRLKSGTCGVRQASMGLAV